MAGKGGKGLLAAKTTAAKSAEKDKGKKAPVSRSSRAGLQVTCALSPLPCASPEICVVLSRRRRSAFRQSPYAKWVRRLGLPFERCFASQNTVRDLFCVWITVCMLC